MYIILYPDVSPSTLYLKSFSLLFKTFKGRGQTETENGFLGSVLLTGGSKLLLNLFLKGSLASSWAGDSRAVFQKTISWNSSKGKKNNTLPLGDLAFSPQNHQLFPLYAPISAYPSLHPLRIQSSFQYLFRRMDHQIFGKISKYEKQRERNKQKQQTNRPVLRQISD